VTRFMNDLASFKVWIIYACIFSKLQIDRHLSLRSFYMHSK
jgi:hypothetical protein